MIDREKLNLEIHHKYYIYGLLPWNYHDSVLQTLCSICHEKEHLTNKPIVYLDKSLKSEVELNLCLRCNGNGYLHNYKHVQNGICFKCWGYGGFL
jgi:hypothetical protein